MSGSSFDVIILVLYGALIIWLIYRLIKANKSKKNLTGEVSGFTRKISIMEYVLLVLLLSSGAINVYGYIHDKNQNALLTGGVMLIMALVFFANTRSKLYVAENGIVITDQFFTYKEIKKWGFDQKRGELVVLTKKDQQENRQSVQVKVEEIENINNLIRKYKLGK